MSSTESEMNALSDGEQESQWLEFLVEELWRKTLAPTLFSIDNKDPSDETNSHSPWGRSHSKPATKDKTKNDGDEKRRTATPSIAHRISQSTGPELLARINQEHHEPQSEQEANASQP
ncbi:hypothetical protein PGT21_013675 [Puccinia graminis f. sp. tritici]|uniref:Uncharacterized protein n=1 Tax=Puccinia graminis f. sp. tritici TaxID=56615 RepID=A0A5B0MET2_PUCGR|nr:hypothetical protein PGT21_013675 [Puccinia graminis f. sp. tritici]